MSAIGIIGLGTMGSAIARNFASRDVRVSVYNRHAEKTQAFLDRYGAETIQGFTKLDGLVSSLPKPRNILLMVDAGAVDAVIEELFPLLESGDTLIDGGNSYFRDTVRRNEALGEKGIRFVCCGISGGEEGALRGPSMMIGSDEGTWQEIQPLLEKVAAKDFKGKPCVGYMGEGGTGHAVKMVHNGIEYAVMQSINDVYHFLRYACALEPGAIADIFDRWRKEGLDGYLMEIAGDILRTHDASSDTLLIEHISDVAHQKGTGKWTSIEALEHFVPMGSITAGVETRFHSKRKEERRQLASLYFPSLGKSLPRTRFGVAPSFLRASSDRKGWLKRRQESSAHMTFTEQISQELFQALRASILCSFAQGINLLEALSEEEPQIDVNEALRVWQGGCIIRMESLGDLKKAYEEVSRGDTPLDPPAGGGSRPVRRLVHRSLSEGGSLGGGGFSLLQTTLFTTACRPDNFSPALIKMIEAHLPHPALAASYQWLLESTSDPLPTTLIQAMRDYFGAHTYQRTDKDGVFHTEWKTSLSYKGHTVFRSLM